MQTRDEAMHRCTEMKELSAANVVMLGCGDESRQAKFDVAAAAALREVLGETYVPVRAVGILVALRCKS